jgi:hypothetical protein
VSTSGQGSGGDDVRGEGDVIMPRRIFYLELLYLVVLVAVLVLYKTWSAFPHAVGGKLNPLPVSVVWFGAVGGVLSGLQGIFFHNQKWDASFNYWHYSRPLVGAVTGSIGALLFLVALRLGTKQGASVKPDVLTLEAVAFVLGFADNAFRSLLQKVTDAVIGPGKTTTGPTEPSHPPDKH